KAVTLRVPEGAICGLIGPNGSGKTTLFNSIVGQHPIDAGSIRFQGREISRLRVARIARLGLLRTFQQTRIYGGMTCMQNMVISVPTSELGWRSMFRKSPPSDLRKADDLLHFVGLHAKRHLRARDLSFGQQKLLEFAMALMSGPRMLLLDEPTPGINPTLINGLLDQLRQVNAPLCIIRPNGAGKSTVLHSIYGFTRIHAGTIHVAGRDITRLSSNEKLRHAGIAYILQDNSVFPDMTVEENLWMGGYLMARPEEAKQAAEDVLQKYPRLANRRHQPARVLSGGERRLLEISRALVMKPTVLLVDEPSIGLEPRYIDMVFEILSDLRR